MARPVFAPDIAQAVPVASGWRELSKYMGITCAVGWRLESGANQQKWALSVLFIGDRRRGGRGGRGCAYVGISVPSVGDMNDNGRRTGAGGGSDLISRVAVAV